MTLFSPKKRTTPSNCTSLELLEPRVLLSASGQVRVVDAGDAGYSQQGAGWYQIGNNGYPALNGDFRFHHAGLGTASAKWEFTSLEPGWYEVGTTWVGQGNRTAAAAYQIHDGLQFEATVSINQKVAPTGAYWDTQRWNSLGRYFVSEGSLSVKVNNDRGGILVADAIQLVRLPDVEITTVGSNGLINWAGGTIPQSTFAAGTTQSKSLVFTNRSTKDITFRALSSNTEHVHITNGAQWTTVGAGATAAISYDLSGPEVGHIDEELLVEITGEVTSELRWNVTAAVTQNLAPKLLSVRQLNSGNPLVANTFQFPASFQNTLPTTTLEFRNNGLSLIHFNSQLQVPAGFEILDQSGAWKSEVVENMLPREPLAPGESFHLTLRTSTAVGVKTGTLVLKTSTNTALTSVQLKATTQAGYVLDEPAVSNWEHRSRPYYNSYNQDFSYASTSWSSTTSQWSAQGLANGEYRVWATWLPGSNRATNATYTVRSGTTLTSTAVNQRVEPNKVGPSQNWQLLTNIQVVNGQVTVQLSNQASGGIVVADAVWIEPVTSPQPDQYIIDDGTLGYSEVGVGWFARTAAWFPSVDHDMRYAGSDWSPTTAQWKFDTPGSGTWEIFASWLPGTNRANDATYSVITTRETLKAVINQQQSPDDVIANGTHWQSLGRVQIQSGEALRVALSNAASSGIVVADAIMIRRIPTMTPQPLPLTLNDSFYRSGDAIRVAALPQGTGEFQFWLKSEHGWELAQSGSSPVWETSLDHGTYQVRVDFRSDSNLTTATQTLSLEVRESEAQLWERIISPYLQDELWNFEYRYDAANYLMVPLVDAFESGNIERQLEFKQHFDRLTSHGADSNGDQGDLSWLQYLSLASRFVSEAALAGREEIVSPELLDLLYSELDRYWLDAPAFAFSGPAFQGMKQRLEWKLSVNPALLSKSYFNAIIDHETFIMSVAADLKTFERLSTQIRNDSVINDVLVVTRRMFEQRGQKQGNRWLFQIGVWDDHPDFAYAGNSNIISKLFSFLVDNVAPDSAHAHRIPALLNSLIHAQPEDGYYQSILAGAEQQFFQKVLVKPTADFSGYRMTNYMDGRNGVYRYGNLLENGDGYDAYELSGRLLYGWWTFLDSDRIRDVYREISESFDLESNVETTYSGPLDTRETHPITKLPSAYSNGFLELTTLLASQFHSPKG